MKPLRADARRSSAGRPRKSNWRAKQRPAPARASRGDLCGSGLACQAHQRDVLELIAEPSARDGAMSRPQTLLDRRRIELLRQRRLVLSTSWIGNVLRGVRAARLRAGVLSAPRLRPAAVRGAGDKGPPPERNMSHSRRGDEFARPAPNGSLARQRQRASCMTKASRDGSMGAPGSVVSPPLRMERRVLSLRGTVAMRCRLR
jgi:hypothetical protein